MSVTDQELIDLALQAREKAYVPYSHHPVGAALLTAEGKVYTGCNVENAAYTPSNCAERTAVFKAVSEGDRNFVKIAIVGGLGVWEKLPICPPCGICRQVLREFCDPESFEILLGTNEPGRFEKRTLKELLPMSFGPESLLKNMG